MHYMQPALTDWKQMQLIAAILVFAAIFSACQK